MPDQPSLSLAEWVVLAVIDEAPTHGFAVASLTTPDGPIGRVWHVPRPIVYRALPRLEEAGLVAPGDVGPGHGPDRHPYTVTRAGRTATRRWLRTPVRHVRDVRSELLVKLALLDRRGQDPAVLLAAQREQLSGIAEGLLADDRPSERGFDATLTAWRRANLRATLDFLAEMGGGTRGGGPSGTA